ncbi:hypothetical protein ACHAO7_011172 [Fusarium culmorum]
MNRGYRLYPDLHVENLYGIIQTTGSKMYAGDELISALVSLTRGLEDKVYIEMVPMQFEFDKRRAGSRPPNFPPEYETSDNWVCSGQLTSAAEEWATGKPYRFLILLADFDPPTHWAVILWGAEDYTIAEEDGDPTLEIIEEIQDERERDNEETLRNIVQGRQGWLSLALNGSRYMDRK